MAYRAALLNDNGDGTMTILGKRELPEATGRYPAIVVSAVALPSDGKNALGKLWPTKSNSKTPIGGNFASKILETATPRQITGVKGQPDTNKEQGSIGQWSAQPPGQRHSLRPKLSPNPTKVTPVPIPVYPQPYLQKAPNPAALTPAQPDTSILTASLELEEWELAPGRIRGKIQDRLESTSPPTQNPNLPANNNIDS